MHLISIPEELALPHLLELGGVPSMLRDRFFIAYEQLCQGQYEVAVNAAKQVVKAAGDDRYVASLGNLLHAEILRRMGRWEEALDAILRALYWLELQVHFRAHYNEAVAVYLEGCIHYALQAEDKVLQTFTYAQEALAESAGHWDIENNPRRFEDCRNLRRWISQLSDLQGTLSSGEFAFILPVYEVVGERMIRADVFAVRPFQVMMPAELIAQYLPDRYVPVVQQTIPMFSLEPGASYIAIRIPTDHYLLHQGRKGDVLVMEVVRPDARGGEAALTSDQPFVRRGDGRIEFRPVVDSAQGLTGIARILIREGEEI